MSEATLAREKTRRPVTAGITGGDRPHASLRNVESG